MTVNMVDPQQTGSILSGVIPEQPDTNTVELATYGDTYLSVKSALYVLDMMHEIAQRDYERLIASCHGDEYRRIRNLFVRRPGIVSQERPHVENYQELQDVKKAKKIYRAASTVRTIETWKVEVKAYGSMHGAYEYGHAMMESGISADLMRRVFKERASKGMTNSYASIRDMREGHLMDGLTEEERSLVRMAEMIYSADEFDRMMSEYPEDDSSERIQNEYMEALQKSRHRGEEPVVDDVSESEGLDPSVLGVVPDSVGVDFVGDVLDDEDDEGDDVVDGERDDDDGRSREGIGPVASSAENALDAVPMKDRGDEGRESMSQPEESDEGGRIGPIASSVDDALEAVPLPEHLHIGPGTPEEQRFFLDSKYGKIERIGPVVSSPYDAMDAVDKILSPFMPPSHPDDFARWYGRTYLGELRRMAVIDVDIDEGGDGMVIIAKPKDPEEERNE